MLPDININACSPLRQAVVTVLCTSVGINQGEQSGLCHSVSDAYNISFRLVIAVAHT